jgi:pimeloyl-ACP methyl ester carboxylesterase
MAMTKSILEDRTVSKRFLFPREKHFSDPFMIRSSKIKLSCYKQERFKNAKMLVVFHASNEIVEDYTESFAHEVEKMGVNLLIAEYPGYSMSTGTPSLINILEVIPAIIKNCGTPVNDLVVFGRSLGTTYAIEAVSQFPEIKGLIIESGISDFYERLDRRVSAEDIDSTEEELKKEVLKYFDIERKLKRYKGSTLIMHTKDDRIIDARHALQNFEWANDPKELKIFEAGDHSDIQFLNKREYFDTIREFIEKL